ncbi:hypothetical protein KSP39_PZI004501 [Platanthera zijinensis]|uniref:Retrotransposon gag domain-containing protein n=1 Tax=Platanthera zijinensis TaxID=2320716 RepID=A0AAP0BWE3_9ASPA
MAKRNARTADGSALGRHTEPARSHSLVDVPLTAEVALAPVAALEGRVRQMEEQQTEMLALLRNMGAPPVSSMPPAPANPPLQPNPERVQEEPEDYSDAANSTYPAQRGVRADHLHHHLADDIHPPPLERFTREEIREVIAEEYRRAGRRDFQAHRPLCQGSPLTPQILDHPIPHGFKLPNIETFDGTYDPLEHVNHFTTIMRIYNAPDQLLCQVFPTTLKGQARTWFHSLRAGTITNFAELTRQFTDQFIANRRIIRDPSHLSGIRQNEGESLRDFFRRFTSEARQIPGVDPELLRGVFLGGLRPSGFYSALMRETVPSYPELVHRVEAQIAADEAIEAHRQQFGGGQKRRKEEEPTLIRQEERCQSERRRSSRQRDLPRNGGQHPFQEYTPLNTTRTNVMYAIQNDPAFQRPRASRPNPKADQTRYCEFHRATGHNTEECAGLKDEIERLVRQGLLGRFLQGQAQIQAQGNGGGRQMVGNIETIVGSPAMNT